MPQYINVSKTGTSYSKNKIYKRGQIATLDKEYAETKPGSWKLLDTYNAEMRIAREASALKETPVEQVERLKKELKIAQTAKKKITTAEEKIPNLVKKGETPKAEAKKEEK